MLDRSPNWDPATDLLRKAWVDRIQVETDVGSSSIQRAIEREEADLSLTSHVLRARLTALQADPEQSGRLSVDTTGILLYLALGTHPGAGAIADVRVCPAVNYAIDKVAYRDALASRYAPPASWPPPCRPGLARRSPPSTCARPRVGGVTRRPGRCSPRPATPTG